VIATRFAKMIVLAWRRILQLLISLSTFCLDTKSGAKNSRTTQMPPAVCPASTLQHSDTFDYTLGDYFLYNCWLCLD
jgi:hypothetical protein